MTFRETFLLIALLLLHTGNPLLASSDSEFWTDGTAPIEVKNVVKRDTLSSTMQSTILNNETYYYATPVTTDTANVALYTSQFNAIFSSANSTVIRLDSLNSTGAWNESVKVQLQFVFYFFGHPVGQVAISRNGYISIADSAHEPGPTNAQFIAPMAADFKAADQNRSTVSYSVTSNAIWVRWANLTLPVASAQRVSFQGVIFKNGSMVFHYYNVNTSKLPEIQGFRAGVADVYNYRATVSGRDIIETIVHKPELINVTKIVNNSAVLITAIPSCGQLTGCGQCLTTSLIDFTCNWCFERGQCGTLSERRLQSWLNYPCHFPADSRCLVGERPLDDADRAARGILAFFLALFLAMGIGFVIFFCVYGHKKPESRFGQCLLHARSQLRERFTGLPRVPNIMYRASNPQVRLEEDTNESPAQF